MSLGNRLRQTRQMKGLTQKQLAELSGEKNTSISNWELELNQPSAESLANLCKALGVSADYLLDWDENKHSDKCRFCYDDEASNMVEQIYDRPEMRTLFSLCRDARKEDVEKAIQIIQMFKNHTGEC